MTHSGAFLYYYDFYKKKWPHNFFWLKTAESAFRTIIILPGNWDHKDILN